MQNSKEKQLMELIINKACGMYDGESDSEIFEYTDIKEFIVDQWNEIKEIMEGQG